MTRAGLRNAMAAAALALGLAAAAPALADGITDGSQGREALLAGNVDEAIRLFGRAIAFGNLDSRNRAITLNLRANAYLAKGQTEVALDDANESLRLADTPDGRFTRAKVFIAQFRFDDAVQDLTQALSSGGQAADVWALRGHAQLYAGRLDAALKDLDQAVKLQPDYGFAWRTRGHVQLNLGQDDKAIADESRAIALDPKDIEAYWLRAYAWRYRKKDLAKAVADYGEALKIDPSDSAARTGRADAYEELGRPAEALADYDAWIRQNPRGAFGYAARGRLHLAQGRPAEAAADLAKAVSLKPADAGNVIWLHLARARSQADDAAELQRNAARVDRNAWPGPLLDYLTGNADAAAVLAKAGQGQGKSGALQICEAQMVLGQEELARGRRPQAVERLRAAAQACAAGSREARLIRADLQKAGVAPPAARPALAAAVIAAPPHLAAAPKPATTAPRPKPAAPAAGGDLLLRGSLR